MGTAPRRPRWIFLPRRGATAPPLRLFSIPRAPLARIIGPHMPLITVARRRTPGGAPGRPYAGVLRRVAQHLCLSLFRPETRRHKVTASGHHHEAHRAHRPRGPCRCFGTGHVAPLGGVRHRGTCARRHSAPSVTRPRDILRQPRFCIPPCEPGCLEAGAHWLYQTFMQQICCWAGDAPT